MLLAAGSAAARPRDRSDSRRAARVHDDEPLCLELGVDVAGDAARDAEVRSEPSRGGKSNADTEGPTADRVAHGPLQRGTQRLPRRAVEAEPTGLIKSCDSGPCHSASYP